MHGCFSEISILLRIFFIRLNCNAGLKDGDLTKLSVAFSRDTDKKVYVQHRMLENVKKCIEWLKEGAVIYVCGDEKHMAHDVDQTLRKLLQNRVERRKKK